MSNWNLILAFGGVCVLILVTWAVATIGMRALKAAGQRRERQAQELLRRREELNLKYMRESSRPSATPAPRRASSHGTVPPSEDDDYIDPFPSRSRRK